MGTNYQTLIRDNLSILYKRDPQDIMERIPALGEGNAFLFRAFGEDCCIAPEGITLSGRTESGPKALIISLYAIHVTPDSMEIEPFRAFKDMPGSMPYHGAFSANSERILIPHVARLQQHQERILHPFQGNPGPENLSGDFSLVLFPLPKIALAYVFYLLDDEFPASATCLLSSNAPAFMPLDGLADVAEYTSQKMIQLIQA